ncbi:hypothetical protein EVAR_38967_1 [Eumeta japonica]|uniref:Uncharacterized protein n=1 Tax=Eumeta variegata TaxID=151549 RepID=A0A4C1W7M4_EUMVA|nr:hypothetical protein EVAR_38967_1 [Eumeta japonica]
MWDILRTFEGKTDSYVVKANGVTHSYAVVPHSGTTLYSLMVCGAYTMYFVEVYGCPAIFLFHHRILDVFAASYAHGSAHVDIEYNPIHISVFCIIECKYLYYHVERTWEKWK